MNDGEAKWPADTTLSVMADYPAFIEVTEEVFIGQVSPLDHKQIKIDVLPHYGASPGKATL